MTTDQITQLDEKLLLGWQCGPLEDDRPATAGWNPGSDDAAHRPGYDIFKLLLLFSLFLGGLALFPWSHSAHGMEAGGYVYLSVPLNAAEPQFDKSAIRVDVMGAGLHVNVLEMRQDTGTTRFLVRKGTRKGWSAKRRAMESDSRTAGYSLVSTSRRDTTARHSPSRPKSSQSHYLKLLNAYNSETSRQRKRALYPQLISAYNRARNSR